MMSLPTLQSDASIRMAHSFLEFLSTVQTSDGAEKEKVDNLKQMLMDVFKVKQSMEATIHVSLYNLLYLDSKEKSEQNESTSEPQNIAHMTHSRIDSSIKIGPPLVNLFHEFHLAVTTIGFFDSSTGDEYLKRKSRAKEIFKDAIEILRTNEDQTFDHKDLADGLKILGNNAMHVKCYGKAVVMYSCAIALCKENAIYFCNRAAAFTEIGKFNEAINDCREAIKINPRYAMAFYRLGYAYYEQGKNLDTIREGFVKVLQLEPHNQAAKVCLWLADFKFKAEVEEMREQFERLMGDGSVTQAAAQQSTLLAIEEVGDGIFEVIEEAGEINGDNEDTITLVDLIELYVRTTPPPE